MNNLTLVTETVSVGEWIVANGIPSDYLKSVHVKVGDVEKAAFIEGTKVLVRCPQLEPNDYPVRVDGRRIGTLRVSR